MDELLDILTPEGKPTGNTALKSEAHQLGLYHNTIHIWFFTKNREILLQQRAKSKTIYPLLWDVSVAGHISAGESVEQGAVREAKEEIGLEISEDNLIKIGEFERFRSYNNQFFDNEFQHTFIAELNVPISKLVKQDEEVEALKLITISEFKQILKNIGHKNHFVKNNKPYYEFILKSIISKLEL